MWPGSRSDTASLQSTKRQFPGDVATLGRSELRSRDEDLISSERLTYRARIGSADEAPVKNRLM